MISPDLAPSDYHLFPGLKRKSIEMYCGRPFDETPSSQKISRGVETTRKTPRNTIAETASFILIRPLEAVTLNKLLGRAHTCSWFLARTPTDCHRYFRRKTPEYRTFFFCFFLIVRTYK
jgi:hypothetical protein